jgi:hypothetical protein
LKKHKYDIFISHASEDKDSFVRVLAEKLESEGYNVWYDEFTLELGSSLTESIQKGIKESLFGLIILSKSFFKKEWTKRELNALMSKELLFKEKILLPIWLDVSFEEVFNFSPILVDRLSVKGSSDNIDLVLEKVKEKLSIYKVTRGFIKVKVDSIIYSDCFNKKREYKEAIFRFDKLIGFQEKYQHYSDFYMMDRSVEDIDENEEEFLNLFEEIRIEYDLPKSVWLEEIAIPDESLTKEIKNLIEKVIFGEIGTKHDSEVAFEFLEEIVDIDVPYVLLGIPYGNINANRGDYDYLFNEIKRLATGQL